MSRWFCYSDNVLFVGRGRVVRGTVADNLKITEFIVKAGESYFNNAIHRETYIAAFVSGLAMQELGEKIPAQKFASLKEVYGLFAGEDIEQLAVDFLNGRVASSYSSGEVGERVNRGFISGELLMLPRDNAGLYAPENISKLPGLVAFLLAKSDSERKAFNNYLRKGVAPSVSVKDYAGIRPVLPSFSRELRLLGGGR